MSALLRTLALTLASLAVAEAAMPPAKVVLEPVTERQVRQTSRMVGVIDFDRVSDVASEVRGIISAQFLREGQRVKKQQRLVQLNNEFTLQDIRITELEIGQVDAELEKLSKNLKRLESLKLSDATSERAYEESYYDYQSQLKKKDALKQRIERMLLQMRKSQVRAPFDAVVLSKFKEVGEWTAPEAPIAKLGSIHDVIAKVAIAESVIPYIDVGADIALEVPSLALKTQGKVRGFTPVADLRSKSVYLKIDLDYRTNMFQNLSVNVEVPTSDKRLLKIIKRDALVRFNGQEFVYIVSEGKAKMLPVTIVSRLGEEVAVDGPALKVGMSVVVEGNARLRPDQPVNVVAR